MKRFGLLGAIVFLLAISTTLFAFAAQATNAQRQELAQAIADEMHSTPSTFHHLTGVEIGAAVVIGYYALGNWQTPDRAAHGQVSFYLACDHWNVGSVSFGRALTAKEINAMEHPFGDPHASKLIAELNAVNTQNFAYLKPPPGKTRC